MQGTDGKVSITISQQLGYRTGVLDTLVTLHPQGASIFVHAQGRTLSGDSHTHANSSGIVVSSSTSNAAQGLGMGSCMGVLAWRTGGRLAWGVGMGDWGQIGPGRSSGSRLAAELSLLHWEVWGQW